MNFNDSQIKAINHKEGPCLVLAGPGSGKTAVITQRILQLINSGIPSEEILVITFTKAAAVEMKERFNRLSGGNHQVTFGTFHSLFWGILQKELGFKSSDIIMGKYRENLIKEAITMAGEDADDLIMFNSVSSEISLFGNKFVELTAYESNLVDSHTFRKIYKNYVALKKKYRVVDFDDMLTKAYEMFSSDKRILEKWQKRFSYILIDEMQDMNNLQFQLISMLAKRTNNIFCVGDDDQSIYGFRGANPGIMKDFTVKYPDTNRILLNYNYRNPCNVVEASTKLIGVNIERFQKDINHTNPKGNIIIEAVDDEIKEADRICQIIRQGIADGKSYEDYAILYRNHTDAKFVITKLVENQVPIYLKEQMANYYSHFIIEDIEAYFQIAIGNSTRARILRIMNRPNRFLHRASAENASDINGLLRFYQNNGDIYRRVEALKADLTLLSKMSPIAAVNYIFNVIGYGDFLRQEAVRNGTDFQEYADVIDFYKELIRDCKTIKKALDKTNLMRYKIDYENKNKVVDRAGKVGLFTLHSSKGLEFDTVFIVSVNEGIIPTNKADSIREIEAERRLFYVGITRCKKNLYITYTNKKNRDKSRFINEMKLDDYSSESSSKISSKRAETASYSSSDSILSSEGAPVSSSK